MISKRSKNVCSVFGSVLASVLQTASSVYALDFAETAREAKAKIVAVPHRSPESVR